MFSGNLKSADDTQTQGHKEVTRLLQGYKKINKIIL